MRLRITSIDWLTSEDMRSLMPSGVSETTSLPSGASEKASSGTPLTENIELVTVFCSVCTAVRACSSWLGSVSSMVIESGPVVMMLPMPF